MSSIAYKCLLVHWDSLYNNIMDCPTGTQGFLPNTDITSYTWYMRCTNVLYIFIVVTLSCPCVLLGHWDVNGMYQLTYIHSCYRCLSHPRILLGHWDRNAMYQHTYLLLLSVPSICTAGTLGRKCDVPTYILVTVVCPIHVYCWDTWTEMGYTNWLTYIA